MTRELQHRSVDTDSAAAIAPQTALFVRTVARSWKLILGCTLLTTALVTGLSFLLPNWYEAEVSAVPATQALSPLESILGGTAGILRDLGVMRLGVAAREGYNFLVILESRRLKDSLINRFRLWELYDLPDTARDRIHRALEDDFSVRYELNGNYVVSVLHKDPRIAAEMANAAISIANTIAAEVRQTESGQLRQYLEQRLAQLDATLARLADSLQRLSRRTLLFSPLDQAQAAARALVELKAQALHQQILTEALRQAYGPSDPIVQAQRQLLNELAQQVRRAEMQPGLVGNFPLREAADVGLRFLQLYAELETHQRVRSLLLSSIEQARVDEQRTRPLLYVVDPAVPPQLKARPKRVLIAAGSFVGSLLLTLLGLLAWQRWRSLQALLQQRDGSPTTSA